MHYLLSPSASERWLACPSSLDHAGENNDSKFSREGTAAHEYAAAWLRNGEAPPPPILCETCNTQHETETEAGVFDCPTCGQPTTFVVRDDFPVDVAEYVEHCRGLLGYFEPVDHGIERTIESFTIDGFGGTLDFYIVYRVGDELFGHVVDLKFGKGVQVDAVGNPQLRSYALLLRELVPNLDRFRVTIVQPRGAGDTLRGDEFDAAALDDFQTEILAAVEQRQAGNAYFAGDHCRWCRHKTNCDEALAVVREAARQSFGFATTTVSAKSVDPEALAAELDKLAVGEGTLTEGDGGDEPIEQWLAILKLKPLIESMLNEIPARLLARMQRGVAVPGYKAVRSIGNRTWFADEETVLKRLRKRGIGKRLACKPKLLSPTQLEKLVDKPEDLTDLIVRPFRGYAVAPESDRREAVIFETVQEQFNTTADAVGPEDF